MIWVCCALLKSCWEMQWNQCWGSLARGKTTANSAPFKWTWKGKSSSISHCIGGETGSGERTKKRGVLSTQEFGREATKAVLSDRDRKSTPKYLRACRAPLLSLSSEHVCFCASLAGLWGLAQQGLKCICLGIDRSKDEAGSKYTRATAAAQPSQLQ